MKFNTFDLDFLVEQLVDECDVSFGHFTFGGVSGLVARGYILECEVAQLWMEKEAFEKLCVTEGVINHPMRDTVVVLDREPTDHRVMRVEIRERNDYFPSVEMLGGTKAFNDLTLMIHMRNDYTAAVEEGASKEVNLAILSNIRLLNNRLAAKNKVNQAA